MEIDKKLCKDTVNMLAQSDECLEIIKAALKKNEKINHWKMHSPDVGIFWNDIANAGGWRIQYNKTLKNYRLLSPDSFDQGWAPAKDDRFSKYLATIVSLGNSKGRTDFAPYERRVIIVTDKNYFEHTDIPQYPVAKAMGLFKFPPNHPAAETAYAMTEVFPTDYVPLCEFHAYYRKSKHTAFIELCANLGAKNICVESIEINNKSINANTGVSVPLAELDLGLNITENSITGEKIAFTFGQENSAVREYNSPWLVAEPDWKAMRDLRKNNHVKTYKTEFNISNDMGVSVNLATNINKTGVSIGGSFTQMTKISIKYRVEFWDIKA